MKKVLSRSLSPKSSARTVPSLDASVTTLPNGLEVIVREDQQHPLGSVQVWVKAGSLHEEQWTGAGLAHCVEHMLFKGTEKRDPAQISQGIQALGGYVNAYTSFNRTVYWIDGLAGVAPYPKKVTKVCQMANLYPQYFQVVALADAKVSEWENLAKTDPSKLFVLRAVMAEEDYLGWVEISSNVPGAEIFIDDKSVGPVGKTPLDRKSVV